MTDVTEVDPVSGDTDNVVAPTGSGPVTPRLARHRFTLSDGHEIGLAVSGRGVPLVVVHGFTAEGILYAQTLNRLVRKGFKVIAIDLAGHGDTAGLPGLRETLGGYADLMARSIDELGIRRAVLAGHSMGGRVIADVAAARPDLAIAVVLIDAIVGDPWDKLVRTARFVPAIFPLMGTTLMIDSLSTIPLIVDRGQAAKLGRLVAPMVFDHIVQPWRLIGPSVAIMRSPGSAASLDALARHGVPTYVLHGEADLIVPFCTARSAAARSNGQLVAVHKAAHSWLLRDPETLPAIMADLLEGSLGHAVRAELPGAGAGSLDEIEATLYDPGAPILAMTPATRRPAVDVSARAPRYTWSIEDL